jgi:hypothetical protein
MVGLAGRKKPRIIAERALGLDPEPPMLDLRRH